MGDCVKALQSRKAHYFFCAKVCRPKKKKVDHYKMLHTLNGGAMPDFFHQLANSLAMP